MKNILISNHFISSYFFRSNLNLLQPNKFDALKMNKKKEKEFIFNIKMTLTRYTMLISHIIFSTPVERMNKGESFAFILHPIFRFPFPIIALFIFLCEVFLFFRAYDFFFYNFIFSHYTHHTLVLLFGFFSFLVYCAFDFKDFFFM